MVFCDLQYGHWGNHIDYDIGGKVRQEWTDLAKTGVVKRCHVKHPSSPMYLCNLFEGHIGPHRDTTVANPVVWAQDSTVFHRCNAKHPSRENVYCPMVKGHQGFHHEVLVGNEVVEWPSGYDVETGKAPEPKPQPKLAQQPQEITLENEIGDNSDLLEWARSRNPKMFKTKGRDVASALCNSADKTQHQKCKEPWCDCPCHDLDDIASDQRRRTRGSWGCCLGLLLLLLNQSIIF